MARRDWYCEDVLSGKLDVKVTWENELVLAFHHPQPTAEIHLVVIPKEHISSLLDPEALDGDLFSSMLRAIQESARKTGQDRMAFMYV